MQTHNIHAAKTHFSQLVDAAAGGETIIIAKAGVPVAKLVPITAPKRRGMLAGVTFNAEASDALDAEIADMFEGKA
ncbi:type II toxin-antitoxin system Phd/YefM family antitoxin [Pseudomonas lundensis]|uniref:type II toxin-antitoxin system Phd/YefM family antitoxin n=1 Tax=Pseudomonas lundensis TaxID=86185 RepID=UPI000BA24763|nr:type II toxin-antitoxin system prevent-host-death family antitoxin [Pseudomonas lundensis]NNA14931.1 type II toxin-antitoxin system Phd/YefM family antitoxin [Pseudomonas lundensis]OZY44159.1 type II toxin-antitoxin system prevent-host-death family antitoxin [Pseudomonas lundensis]